MARSVSKHPIDVVVRIQTGPASISQQAAWYRFWQGLVAQATDSGGRFDEGVWKDTEQ